MAFIDGYAKRLGVLHYLGTWDASTNTPSLTSGIGEKNGYYIVSVQGETTLDGFSDWEPGDWAIFNGITWQQVDNQRGGGLSLLDGGGAAETGFDSNVIIDGGSA